MSRYTPPNAFSVMAVHSSKTSSSTCIPRLIRSPSPSPLNAKVELFAESFYPPPPTTRY